MEVRIHGLFLAVGALIIAVQSGSPSSIDGRENPSVNIVGHLVDTNGHEYPLEYITIAGRYSQIPLYQKPDNADQDPEINTTKIDLDEVDEIFLAPGPSNVLQFKKRDYIELVVLFKGSRRTQNHYIIERNREIRAQEFLGDGAGSLDHEFKFLALKKLKIHGIKNSNCRYEGKKITDMHDINITKTNMLLEEIMVVAQQLPEDSSTMAGTLKKQLLYLVDELKKTVRNWFT